MSPIWPLSLIFSLSCLCFLSEGKMAHSHGKLKPTSEQAKKSQTNKVGHRSKWWLIETTSNKEGGTTNNEEDETTNNEEGKTTNNEEGETTNNEEDETTNNEEGVEHGVDYQDDDIEPVCSSDRHGSVGLAIDTTS